MEVNVLKFWASFKFEFPELFELSSVVHGAPYSQVSVERSFSALALVLTSRRGNLSDINIRNVLMVKLNFELLAEVVFK